MDDWILLEPVQFEPEIDEFAQIAFYQPKFQFMPKQDNIILVDYKYYLNELYDCFHHDRDNIIKLFYVDVPREKLIINNVIYSEPYHAYKKIDSFNVSRNNKDLLYMLSTQCSMILPCQILNNVYIENTDKIEYLGETREGKLMNINIVYDEEQKIDINKVMRIFYINNEGNDRDSYILNINIKFDMRKSDYILISWRTE